VIIRKARAEEIPALTKIVEESHRHWGYPQDWISHTQSDPLNRGNSEVFVAEDSAGLQGFYRIAADQSKPTELWVSPAQFGTGVGKELFLHAMDHCGKTGRG
jgi:GNAT superfamily N-acetyltransferase